MLRVFQRARSAVRRHRLKEFLPLLVRNLGHVWKRIRTASPSAHSEFDEQFQIETERVSEIGSLNIDSPNAKYAIRYQPSSPEVVRGILSRLNIRYDEFTFVDFGAGKGRVLLIGSEFPFAQVIGIEFSPELVKAAQENIEKFASPLQKTTHIHVLLADVTDYEIPEVPLVCYFYNPFQKPILDQVASRLHLSVKKCQREIYLVYVEPKHREVFDESGAWTSFIQDPMFVVYRSRYDSDTRLRA